MAIYVNKNKINFHKTYLDRIPKLYMQEVESFQGDYLGVTYTIRISRSLKHPKFYWIIDFGAVQCYWSDIYDQLHLDQMQNLIFSFIEAFVKQVKNDPYYAVCKSSDNGD